MLEKVALRALDEQRRTRQWNAMFRLMWFGLALLVFAAVMGWIGKPDKDTVAASAGRHTALVDLEGVIAPGTKASAERMIKALDRAFFATIACAIRCEIGASGVKREDARKRLTEMTELLARVA